MLIIEVKTYDCSVSDLNYRFWLDFFFNKTEILFVLPWPMCRFLTARRISKCVLPIIQCLTHSFLLG